MRNLFKTVEELTRYIEWPADSEIEHVNPEVYKNIKEDRKKEQRRRRRSGDPRVREAGL